MKAATAVAAHRCLASYLAPQKKPYPINLNPQLEVGQKVTLSLDDSHVVKHAFAVYMLPLLLQFGIRLNSQRNYILLAEGWQILAALLGGITGFLIAKTSREITKARDKSDKNSPN